MVLQQTFQATQLVLNTTYNTRLNTDETNITNLQNSNTTNQTNITSL